MRSGSASGEPRRWRHIGVAAEIGGFVRRARRGRLATRRQNPFPKRAKMLYDACETD